MDTEDLGAGLVNILSATMHQSHRDRRGRHTGKDAISALLTADHAHTPSHLFGRQHINTPCYRSTDARVLLTVHQKRKDRK